MTYIISFCWACIILTVVIIIVFYALNFSQSKERFTPSEIQEEQITRIEFPLGSILTLSLMRIGNGLGRIMLINKNGSIPLLLSFDGTTMKILHFIEDKWYEDAETIVTSDLSNTVSLRNVSNKSIEIQLNGLSSYSYTSMMPLNVTAIKYFNSFGRFFSNRAGLSIL